MDSVIKCVHCGKLMTDPVVAKADSDGAQAPATAAEPGASAGGVATTTPGIVSGASPGPASGATPMGVQASQAAATSHNQLPQQQQQQQQQSRQEPYFVMKTQPTNVPPGMPSPSAGYVGSTSNLSATLAGLLMALGGVLAVAGAFLPWVTVDVGVVDLANMPAGFDPADFTQVFKGIAQFQGWLIVLDGAVVALAGGAYLITGRAEGDTSSMRKAIVPALFLAAFTAWLYFDYRGQISQAKELFTSIGLGDKQAAAVLEAIQITWSPGVWMAIGGAVLSLLGVLLAFLASGPKVTAIAPGGANWVGAQPPPSPAGR